MRRKGRLLLATGALLLAGSVVVWRVSTGAAGPVLVLPRADARSLAFSGDGRLLAAANAAGVRIWRVPGGDMLAHLPFGVAEAPRLALSHDGHVGAAAVTQGKRQYGLVWFAASSTRASTVPPLRVDAEVTALAVSPDGTAAATGGGDGTVALWTAGFPRPRWTRHGHRGPVRAVGFAPGGHRLASGGQDGACLLWSAADGREERRLAAGQPVTTLTLGGTPTKLTVLTEDEGAATGTLQVWRAADGFRLGRRTMPFPYVSALSADGAVLALGATATNMLDHGADGFVSIYSSRDGRLLKTLQPGFGQLRAVALSRAGSLFAVSAGYGRDEEAVTVWTAGP